MTLGELQAFTQKFIALFDYWGYISLINAEAVAPFPSQFTSAELEDFFSAIPKLVLQEDSMKCLSRIVYACTSARNCSMYLYIDMPPTNASLYILERMFQQQPQLIDYLESMDDFRFIGGQVLFIRFFTCFGLPGVELLGKYMKGKDIKKYVNYVNGDGDSLLVCACEAANASLALRLLELGASPLICGGEARTAMNFAVSRRLKEVVKKMVDLYSYEACISASIGLERGYDDEMREFLLELDPVKKPLVQPIIFSATVSAPPETEPGPEGKRFEYSGKNRKQGVSSI